MSTPEIVQVVSALLGALLVAILLAESRCQARRGEVERAKRRRAQRVA